MFARRYVFVGVFLGLMAVGCLAPLTRAEESTPQQQGGKTRTWKQTHLGPDGWPIDEDEYDDLKDSSRNLRLMFLRLRPAEGQGRKEALAFARKWGAQLTQAGFDVKLYGIDEALIVVQLMLSDLEAVKEYLFKEHEVYELQLDEDYFRRPGDPPYANIDPKKAGKRKLVENMQRAQERTRKEAAERKKAREAEKLAADKAASKDEL